ncbi:14578_t:CDS:2 [Entrophospora sp. SA101]|nr:14578_t:CDS:2 [Entrophospora sp. SA101]CAJ0844640.1 17118_t:CDS:2 [Entrophospora sp. SA101]CAJ0900944.1 2564_t:CDS:2 [Entrophospora sp. SA101]
METWKKNKTTLSELQNVPHQLLDQLKNGRYGYHEVTNKDSLQLDTDHIENFAETYGITGIHPIITDHSGYDVWMLDDNSHCS